MNKCRNNTKVLRCLNKKGLTSHIYIHVSKKLSITDSWNTETSYFD